MTIRFTPNESPTVGVELELHLVDQTTRNLAQQATAILETLAPGGEHPKAKHELFESTIEIITGVCRTPAEAYDDLRATLDTVRAVATRLGIDLLSAGTHPFALAREQQLSPADRYHQLVEQMQWPARRLLICGTHVHVGVRDGERAIAIVNELQRHLPLFLALSASSPYFEGEDSGLASARSKVFESLPTAGLPPQLAGWHDFESFMDTLLDTRCISSIREVWWDVRPHPDFGTVELRMCDATQTLTEARALTALAQAIVADCDARLDAGTLPRPPREWTVRENRWLAGRYGLDAALIVEDPGTGRAHRRPILALIDELLTDLAPMAEALGTTADLDLVRTIVTVGAGAQRQRALVAGGADLVEVVARGVEELCADL